MKSLFSYSLLAAVLSSGLVSAQATTASTTPVGYESLTLHSGFNYLGLRLHSSVIASGTLKVITATSVTDTGADLSAISANPNTLYVLEVENGGGIITEFLGSAVSGSTITTVDNLSPTGANVAVGAAYKIRPASTLSSVFGAANSAGLASGFFGSGGADVIYSPNGTGGFRRFYYDTGYASWANADTAAAVNGAAVALVYADSLLISSTGTGAASITVAGELKKAPTKVVALANAFTYISTVAPAGLTLAGAFGATNPAGFDKGFFGSGGADVVYVPQGSTFKRYYFDSGYNSWADADTATAVTATSIDLPSGVVISNVGAAVEIKLNVPTTYGSL